MVYLYFLITILSSYPLLGQVEIICQNDTCLGNKSGLTISNLESLGVVQNYNLDEQLVIKNNDNESPRDFLGFFNTRSIEGQDILIDMSSKKADKESANSILIVDAVRNLNIDVNGYAGVIGENASQVCAKNITTGAYGVQVRSTFLDRRSNNPDLSILHCDTQDLLTIQQFAPFSCNDSEFSEVFGQVIPAQRWEKKRVCSTMAGRDLCVAKRVSIRCEIFADKINGSSLCCNNVAPPTSNSNWQCDVNRCQGGDSGWYLSSQFRMWEEEYIEKVSMGHSNEHICNVLTGVSEELDDVFEVRNKSYTATVEFENIVDDLTIHPPSGESVISVSFSSGVCGSASIDTSEDFSYFSEWFNAGAGYLRTAGEGRAVDCTNNVADYDSDHYCYNAITALNNTSMCTGSYTDYLPGNQCWEERLPTCNSPNYEDYEEDSYCYNLKINNCAGRTYSEFPIGSHCYKILKERTCGGVASEYPAGSYCWDYLINNHNCSLNYTEYATGSYCYNKKAPSCGHFIGLDIDNTPGIELLPDYNFCVANLNGLNIELYPGVLHCDSGKNYTQYPVGSDCWTARQPVCTGTYTDYPANHFCYEKLRPTCPGVYSDYSEGSYCYEKLIPEICTGEMNEYPDGSFCYNWLRPASCTGLFHDYPMGSYCYEKLKVNCSGVYSDHPTGSYCYRQLEPNCTLGWQSYPAGSYCWKEQMPSCEGSTYTDHTPGSFCYNALYPGQSTELTTAENCAIVSGIGSYCWKEQMPSCGEMVVEDGETPEPTAYEYDSYCWHKERQGSFCYGSYSEYPKNSPCWLELKENPVMHYRENDFCAISCNWNGTYASCDIGAPTSNVEHVLTGANYVGQKLPQDAQMSFKVRFTTLTQFGMERNFDVQTNIKVNRSTP